MSDVQPGPEVPDPAITQEQRDELLEHNRGDDGAEIHGAYNWKGEPDE